MKEIEMGLPADWFEEHDGQRLVLSVPKVEAEIERLRAERDQWNADARRLSGGLLAIHGAPKTIGSSVLRSVAYDVALNCMDGETAEFQIKKRGGFIDQQEATETKR